MYTEKESQDNDIAKGEVSKSKFRIGGTIENKSCSTIWVDPKTVFEPYPNLKNSPLGNPKPKNSPLVPQKVKNYPKIKSKSNVRIEENREN